MERMRNKQASLFLWIVITAFLSQNLVISVVSETFKDQKNYYSPDPGSRTPPRGSHGSPPHGRTPSHGTPPSHTPSHGGGGSYNPTPSTPSPGNCGTPPVSPTPTTPTTPSTPPSGGYYYPPPTTTYVSPPPTTTYVSPPPSPVYETPPTTPINPGTPPTPPTVPTPPFVPDPGTCNYWRTNPAVIWGLLGWWGTLGSAFGVSSGVPGFGASMSLQQALSNTRTDGIGALYREGTASWLNSIANNRFPFTTTQVRNSFVAALASNKAAASQAQVFKMANEGRLKPRT